MEREYTVGAGIILILIVVIALAVYFIVPDFNEAVKQVADDVFGLTAKEKEKQSEAYKKLSAETAFQSLTECIEALGSKKGACTCSLKEKNIPEDYYIRTEQKDNKSFLKLAKGNLKVEGTEMFSLEGLNFCILEKDLTTPQPLPEFVITSKNEELRVNNDIFIDDTPELYSLMENGEQHICFVVDSEIGKEEAKKIREINDCATGKNKAKEKMIKWFEEFLKNYERCKSYQKTYCLCDSVEFNELYEGYDISVVQDLAKKETTFSLYYTKNNKPELVKDPRSSKIIKNNILSLDKKDLAKEMFLKQWRNRRGLASFTIYTPFINKLKAEKVDLNSDIANPEEWPSCAPGYVISKDCKKGLDINTMRNRLIGGDIVYTYQGKSYKELIEELISDQNMRLLVASIIPGESRFDRFAESTTNDKGLMQFNVGTAKRIEVCDSSGCRYVCHPNGCSCAGCYDHRTEPYIVIPAAAKLMEENLNVFKAYSYPEREVFALAAYNAGPETIVKAIEAAKNKNKRITWENVRGEITVDLLKTTTAYKNVEEKALKEKVNIIKCYPDKVETYKLVFEHEFAKAPVT